MRSPAPSSRLALALDRSPAEGLVGALAAVLAHGVAGGDGTDPERAVHEFRKSVRRARALLRLTRAELAPAEYRALLAPLRGAQRATSRLRDVDVLLGVVDRVRGHLGGAPRLDAFAARLGARQRAGRAAHRASALLARQGPVLAAVVERYAAALPAELGWAELEAGLRAAYRRARRGLRSASRDGEDGPFHDWRKSTKELAYQLELLTAEVGGRARKLRDRFRDLAEAQGEVTDLMILREHLRAAGVRPGRRLDRLIERRRRRVLGAGARLFERAPRRFARAAIALIAPAATS